MSGHLARGAGLLPVPAQLPAAAPPDPPRLPHSLSRLPRLVRPHSARHVCLGPRTSCPWFSCVCAFLDFQKADAFGWTHVSGIPGTTLSADLTLGEYLVTPLFWVLTKEVLIKTYVSGKGNRSVCQVNC